MSQANKKNKAETKVMTTPESSAAVLKNLRPKSLLIVCVI